MSDSSTASTAPTAPTASTATDRSPLWRDRRFATYWAGQGVSQFGDRITELALPLIAVTALHASAPTVGALACRAVTAMRGSASSVIRSPNCEIP